MSKRKQRVSKAAADYLNQDNESQPWQEYDDDIFAALEEASGQQQQGNGGEQALPIHRIFADTTQPRRAIPLAVAAPKKWGGTTEGLADVMEEWHSMACNAARTRFEVADFLQEKETIDLADKPAIFTAWVDLLKLAASIRKQGIDVGDPVQGLNNPILVREVGQLHAIVAGERRWLAFNILTYWLESDDWRRIPVRITTASEWAITRAQAEENTQRRQLNAIGLARQFAKLLMTSREGQDGITYTPMKEMVLPGECDRRYYAQVANGNIHRIPRGMGPEFETAMNITTGQMRQYRALLRLTDDEAINDVIWTLADDRDWAEYFMRDLAKVPLDTLREALPADPYRYGSNGIDIESALREAIAAASAPINPPSGSPAPPNNPPSSSPHSAGGGQDYDARKDEDYPWHVGQRVLSPNGDLCRVDEIKRDGSIVLQRLDNLRYITYKPGVTLRPAEEVPPPTPPAAQGEAYGYLIGKWVETPSGRRGTVTALSQKASYVHVMLDSGAKECYAESLTVIDPPMTGSATTEEVHEHVQSGGWYASEGETGAGGQRFWAQASSFTIADETSSAGDPADRPYDDAGGSDKALSVNPSSWAMDDVTTAVLNTVQQGCEDLELEEDVLIVLRDMAYLTPKSVLEQAEQSGETPKAVLMPYLQAVLTVLHGMQVQVEEYLDRILEGVDDLHE